MHQLSSCQYPPALSPGCCCAHRLTGYHSLPCLPVLDSHCQDIFTTLLPDERMAVLSAALLAAQGGQLQGKCRMLVTSR